LLCFLIRYLFHICSSFLIRSLFLICYIFSSALLSHLRCILTCSGSL
jgi:hypothetical protein